MTNDRPEPATSRGGRAARRLAAALVSAVLLAAADADAALWPLAGVALVPWLLATRGTSLLAAIGLGALMGTLFGCCAAPWIPEALRALGSSSASSHAGLAAAALWIKAPAFAVAGGAARSLCRAPAALRVPVTAAAFAACEVLATTWRGGVPAALVGHTQLSATGVAQLAVVGGVPLLSAWLVALNAALASAIAGGARSRRLAAALAASWLATALVGLPWAQSLRPAPPARPAATILVVQPDIPRPARWDARAQSWILENAIAQTTEALARGPDVDAIAWPENLLTVPLESEPRLAASLERAVDAWDTSLVTGLVRADPGGDPHAYRSSVVWIEPRRGVVAAIDKARAVPLLEARGAAGGAAWLAPLFGEAARWPKMREAPSAEAPAETPFPVAVALCYEALFPEIAAARRTTGSVALLHLADDSWIESRGVSRQLLRWSAFRAIEQRLPLVRVAHGGGSAVVDPYGRIVERLPQDGSGSLRVGLEPSAPPALAERAGVLALPLAIFAISMALSMGMGAIVSRRRATPGRSG